MSTIDGVQRIVVFRRLDAYPGFILTFTQSIDEALAPWWHAVWIVVAGWTVAAATVGPRVWLAREWTARLPWKTAPDPVRCQSLAHAGG